MPAPTATTTAGTSTAFTSESEDNQAEIEKGWIIKADTLEELAEKCHATDLWGHDLTIDPQGLAATVEAYNAAAQAGEDAEVLAAPPWRRWARAPD